MQAPTKKDHPGLFGNGIDNAKPISTNVKLRYHALGTDPGKIGSVLNSATCIIYSP